MENSKKKGGIIAIIVAIILAIGGLIGWLVYDKSAGKPNSEKAVAEIELQKILGNTWGNAGGLHGGYRIAVRGKLGTLSSLTIDENGNCTISYYHTDEKIWKDGSFTIGEYMGKDKNRDIYEFTVLNDTAGIVKFEIAREAGFINITAE